MKTLYFINQSRNPYTDLCIINGIKKSDFENILEKRNKEREKECEEGVHGDGFYDRLAFDIEKLGGTIECVEDENIILDY